MIVETQAVEGTKSAPPVTRPAPRDDPDFWFSAGLDIAIRTGLDVDAMTLAELSDLGRTHIRGTSERPANT